MSEIEAGALTVESRARWDDRTLVVERKYEGDVKLTERYTIGETPRRLTIAAKLESPVNAPDLFSVSTTRMA